MSTDALTYIDGKRYQLPFNIVIDHYCPQRGSINDPAAQMEIEWHLECWDGSPCEWVENNLTATGIGYLNELAIKAVLDER